MHSEHDIGPRGHAELLVAWDLLHQCVLEGDHALTVELPQRLEERLVIFGYQAT